MKKDYGTYLLYIVLALVGVGFAISFVTYPISGSAEAKTEKNVEERGFKSVLTGSTGSGDVSVELTPHEVSNGQLEVDIAVNTHSVTLSEFDLKEITTLEYDKKSIKPLSAPSLGGHHASGTLVFEVGKQVDEFKITIRGIPKVEERVFEWR